LFSDHGGPPPIEVAAAIIRRDGRLLITQRPPGTPLEGLWEFPGGKRETGESLEECLQRELREELEIEVDVGGLIDTISHDYGTYRVCLYFFECTLKVGTPRPLACQDLRWVTPADLNSYNFPPADARLLARLSQGPASAH